MRGRVLRRVTFAIDFDSVPLSMGWSEIVNAKSITKNKCVAPISSEEAVNLTIKVSKRRRLHWLIEAKKQGTSLTAAIIEALTARFGSPE